MAVDQSEITSMNETQTPSGDSKVFINNNGEFEQCELDKLMEATELSKKVSDVNTSLSDKGYLSFDIFTNKQVIKGHLNNSGEIESSIAYLCSDYIEIKPNIKYVLGYSKGITQYTVAFYDSNKNFILRESSGQRTDRPKSYDFLTPSNAKYVRIDIGWYGGGVELPISEASFMTLYQYVYDNTEIGVIKNTLKIQDITDTVIKSEFVNSLVLKKQGNHVFGYVRYKNIPPQTPLLDNLPKTLTLHFYSAFKYSTGHPASASLWQSANQVLAYGEQSTSEYIGVIDYICV